MKNLLPFEKIENKVIVRKEAETDYKYGCRPSERKTEEIIYYGIVNIDKPKGPTSHQVSDYIQRILHIEKSGHSGTLDPAVTGVLPTALGRGTRIVQALLTAGKEYIAIMHLHKEVEEKKLRETIQKHFVGKILQMPPIKSSVKRQLRPRTIYYFIILEIDGQDVLFKIGCEAGTYIRKLCLHPKTEIMTGEGLIVASNFYFNHPTIYSFNNGQMIEKNPSAIQKIPSPSKLIKITMSSGISFIVTLDHKLLVSRDEGYKMIEAQKLKESDYLVKSLNFPKASKDIVIVDLLDDFYLIPQKNIINKCKQAFISKYGSIRAMYRKIKLDRKAFLSKSNYAITIRHLKLSGIYEHVKKEIRIFKTQKGNIVKMKTLSKDFFYLLGLIASDGNNTKEKKTARYTRIKFHNKNEVLINKFLEIYKKLFPEIPISKKEIHPNFFQLDTSNSFLATIAASFGIKSPQKDSDLLPVVNVSPNLIKPFLRGYFDGDGSAYYKKTPRNYKTKICLHTISCIGAIGLHKMLLKVEIPNKIFHKNSKPSNISKTSHKIYDVTIGNIASEKKFIKEIGTEHPQKKDKFNKIISLNYDTEADNHYYIGIHFKETIMNNKSNLHRMGGNLNRVLSSAIPITRGFYKKASKMIKLPPIDDFIIEKIGSIKKVKGADYVYDMTVPVTHNFLIETGFVSSNCHDIGQKLDSGAHMAELRRTKAGPFDESTLFTLQELTDAYYYWKEEKNDKFIRKVIQPIENGASHLQKIWVFDTTVESLCHGSDLKVPGISKLNDGILEKSTVAIMTLKDELVALGTAKMNSKDMFGEKGIAVKTEKVFMVPGTYQLK